MRTATVGRRSATAMGGVWDEVASVVAHPFGFLAFTLALAGLFAMARESQAQRVHERSLAAWSETTLDRAELRDAVAAPKPTTGMADLDVARAARLRAQFTDAVKNALADAHEGERRQEGPGSR